MTDARWERLSAQDSSFLLAEEPGVHMHIGAVQIFRADAGAELDGDAYVAAVRRALESVTSQIPRYRQKIAWPSRLSYPVWTDDEHFDLHTHVHHASLPRPGTEQQLKQLTSRIMGRQLDRDRPLWELWVVEGLQGSRIALISKIHHCLMDGAGGVDLVKALFTASPKPRGHEEPLRAGPPPSGWQMLLDDLTKRLALPLNLLRSTIAAAEQPRSLLDDAWARARAVGSLVGWAVRPPQPTPINGRLGARRRCDWLTVPLADVKDVSRALRCSVNDVVLATVAGAIRSFLIDRGGRPEEIDFRVSSPVAMGRPGAERATANHVSSWILRLPIAEADPIRRVEEIRRMTLQLKVSRQALGVQTLMDAAQWLPPAVLSLGARAASSQINMIVTNVPGPQSPLHLLGAKLETLVPFVPHLQNNGLAVAVFSYDGSLCWGFSGDHALIPDLERFIAAVEASFATLQMLTGVRSEDVAAGVPDHAESGEPTRAPVGRDPREIAERRLDGASDELRSADELLARVRGGEERCKDAADEPAVAARPVARPVT